MPSLSARPRLPVVDRTSRGHHRCMTRRSRRGDGGGSTIAACLLMTLCVLVISHGGAAAEPSPGAPPVTPSPEPGPAPHPDPSGSHDWAGNEAVPVVAALAVLLVAAGAWRFQTGRLQRLQQGELPRDRRAEPTGPLPGTVTSLVDAARTMARADDDRGVARLATAEALRLCRADDAALLTWDGARLHLLHTTNPSVFADPVPPGSTFHAVATSGRPTTTLAADEPGVGGEVALAVVAVTAEPSGSRPAAAPSGDHAPVVAVLAVARRRELAFAGLELDQLSLLAPVVGDALIAASLPPSPGASAPA